MAISTVSCTEFSPARASDNSDEFETGGDVEVFSWWTSGGEQEAFESLLEVHQTRVPDADVTNAAVEFAEKARDQLSLRLSNGNPPELFQANMGEDLFAWVETNGRDDSNSVVAGLNNLAQANDWQDVMDPDVLASLTVDGTLYGVPANVHRINALYYRKDLFEEFDLAVPDTLEELIELCETISEDEDLQAASPDGRMACLGLGNKWNWTLSLLTFEMILPAVGGPDFYESYFQGNETAHAPEVLEALDIALQLYCGGHSADCLENSWFNPDINERTWDEGVGKLSEGKALMAPMGDWAKGFLESEAGGSLIAGEEFGVIPFPGTEGTYVFTADSFLLPKGARNEAGARSFLQTVGSKEGQIAFNQLKGSIPARTDVDPSLFDPIQQEAMAAFASAQKVRALSGLLPATGRDSLHPELAASFREESTAIIRRFLRANYPLD